MKPVANYAQICRTLELVDAAGVQVVERLCKAVLEARRKHETFADSFNEGFAAVESEFHECKAQAMLAERKDGTLRPERVAKTEAELLDLLATGFRLLSREYPGAPVDMKITISAADSLSPHIGGIVKDFFAGVECKIRSEV